MADDKQKVRSFLKSVPPKVRRVIAEEIEAGTAYLETNEAGNEQLVFCKGEFETVWEITGHQHITKYDRPAKTQDR